MLSFHPQFVTVDDAEAGTTARLLGALEAIRAQQGETPAPSELDEEFGDGPGRD